MFDQSRERLHGLDHLKSLAILLVLVFYYRAYYGIPAALSPFGVSTIAACLTAAVAGGLGAAPSCREILPGPARAFSLNIGTHWLRRII
ncbi:MAG: hypothetical protein VCE74_20130 [Alphaproteobacteria bacterium]